MGSAGYTELLILRSIFSLMWWAIVVVGIVAMVRLRRRVSAIERKLEIAAVQRADAPRPHDRQAPSVYDLGDGAATPPRPARRP
jgi:hypothetical protein